MFLSEIILSTTKKTIYCSAFARFNCTIFRKDFIFSIKSFNLKTNFVEGC